LISLFKLLLPFINFSGFFFWFFLPATLTIRARSLMASGLRLGSFVCGQHEVTSVEI
jgi:hypothetical protein